MKLKVLEIEKKIEGENIVIFPVLIQNENGNYLVDCGYEGMHPTNYMLYLKV